MRIILCAHMTLADIEQSPHAGASTHKCYTTRAHLRCIYALAIGKIPSLEDDDQREKCGMDANDRYDILRTLSLSVGAIQILV